MAPLSFCLLSALLLLLSDAAAGTASNGDLSIDPLPPVWPDAFHVDFDEETYFGFWTQRTKGRYFYDAAHNHTRVDRDNGVGDRYCGSALPFRNTPCTHLIRDGMRYLVFPEQKYCCKCCSDPSGCGVVSPNWLVNATYLGRDYIYGIACDKWLKAGLQNNYYWHALDQTPVRITMEFTEQMTFRHSSYVPEWPPSSVFDYPSDLDCSLSCYGLCAVLSQQDSLGRKSLKTSA